MDYKQRILDELNKINSSNFLLIKGLKAKFSAPAQ